MRNDGLLYTGMTSKEVRKREDIDKKRAKQDKKAKLEPHIDLILELLDREKAHTVEQMMSQIDVKTPSDEVKAIIASLNLYGQSVAGLKAKIKNIMRAAK